MRAKTYATATATATALAATIARAVAGGPRLEWASALAAEAAYHCAQAQESARGVERALVPAVEVAMAMEEVLAAKAAREAEVAEVAEEERCACPDGDGHGHGDDNGDDNGDGHGDGWGDGNGGGGSGG